MKIGVENQMDIIFEKDEEVSNTDSSLFVNKKGSESDSISVYPKKSFYTNPHIYSNLKPTDINQPVGDIYED